MAKRGTDGTDRRVGIVCVFFALQIFFPSIASGTLSYLSMDPINRYFLSHSLPNELADLLVMPGDIPWVRQDGNTTEAVFFLQGRFVRCDIS